MKEHFSNGDLHRLYTQQAALRGNQVALIPRCTRSTASKSGHSNKKHVRKDVIYDIMRPIERSISAPSDNSTNSLGGPKSCSQLSSTISSNPILPQHAISPKSLFSFRRKWHGPQLHLDLPLVVSISTTCRFGFRAFEHSSCFFDFRAGERVRGVASESEAILGNC